MGRTGSCWLGTNGYIPILNMKGITTYTIRSASVNKASVPVVERKENGFTVTEAFYGHKGRKGFLGGSSPKNSLPPPQSSEDVVLQRRARVWAGLVNQRKPTKRRARLAAKLSVKGKALPWYFSTAAKAKVARMAAGWESLMRANSGITIQESFPDHAGRPGEVGGSLPKGEVASTGAVSPKKITFKPGKPRYDNTPTQDVYVGDELIGSVFKGEKRNQEFGDMRSRIAIGSSVQKGWYAAPPGTTVGKVDKFISRNREKAVEKLMQFHREKQKVKEHVENRITFTEAFPGHRGRKGKVGGSLAKEMGGERGDPRNLSFEFMLKSQPGNRKFMLDKKSKRLRQIAKGYKFKKSFSGHKG